MGRLRFFLGCWIAIAIGLIVFGWDIPWTFVWIAVYGLIGYWLVFKGGLFSQALYLGLAIYSLTGFSLVWLGLDWRLYIPAVFLGCWIATRWALKRWKPTRSELHTAYRTLAWLFPFTLVGIGAVIVLSAMSVGELIPEAKPTPVEPSPETLALSDQVRNWLADRGFEVSTHTDPRGEVSVEGRKDGLTVYADIRHPLFVLSIGGLRLVEVSQIVDNLENVWIWGSPENLTISAESWELAKWIITNLID